MSGEMGSGASVKGARTDLKHSDNEPVPTLPPPGSLFDEFIFSVEPPMPVDKPARLMSSVTPEEGVYREKGHPQKVRNNEIFLEFCDELRDPNKVFCVLDGPAQQTALAIRKHMNAQGVSNPTIHTPQSDPDHFLAMENTGLASRPLKYQSTPPIASARMVGLIEER